jgi:hypothetical protein
MNDCKLSVIYTHSNYNARKELGFCILKYSEKYIIYTFILVFKQLKQLEAELGGKKLESKERTIGRFTFPLS